MQLALDQITKKVGPEQWLHAMSLAPRTGEVTVLLGATQAGKTSLMRIMAGLDVPTQGRVLVDGWMSPERPCANAMSPWSISSSSTTLQ